MSLDQDLGIEEAKAQGLDIEMMRRYVAIKIELDEIGVQVKRLEDERKRIEPQLFELMLANGIQNAKVDGRTLSRRTTTRASILAEFREQAAAVLEEMGLGSIVKHEPTVNANTMAAKVREWLEQDGCIPPEIEKFLSVHDTNEVRVTK